MIAITATSQAHKVATSQLCDAVDIARATYYRQNHALETSSSQQARKAPANALSGQERQFILDLLHSERFVDKTPYEAYYTLLDEGHYYCSPRTLYRLLAEQGETSPRRLQRRHQQAVKPELIATRANEVWSWDITQLLSTQRLVHFHLYVILDIFSRYVVGWLVADRECQAIARQLIQATASKQGIQPNQLTLHADNGPSMTSQTVAQMLEGLGILRTHNRPYTSNDNPFSEAQFKTLKYCPTFPARFETLQAAESFCQTFFRWYNQVHFHSGIAWLPPEVVHYGRADDWLDKRHHTLLQAYEHNPARFNHQPPKRVQLPKAVYINPPQTVAITSLQTGGDMA